MQLIPGGVFQPRVALFDAMEQDLLGQRAADLAQGFYPRQLHLVIVVLKQLYQVGDRVFFGSEKGVVRALDVVTGEETWRFETGSAVVASPAVADGRLVIGADNGVLYCFGEGG